MAAPEKSNTRQAGTQLKQDHWRKAKDHLHATSGMAGRIPDILVNTAILTLPMLIFSVVLLGIVYAYRVQRTASRGSTLALSGDEDELGVVYVAISATRLVFIASWSSTAATLVSGSIMALWAYHAASSLVRRMGAHQIESLPTPYQFSLMLTMLSSGGFKPLWLWLRYIVEWRGKRQRMVSAVKGITVLLFVANALTLVVLAADTWLHNAVTTVPYDQVQPVTDMTAFDRSFELFPGCATWTGVCSIDIAGPSIFITNGSTALRALSNASDSVEIATYVGDQPYVYLAAPSDKAADGVVDYRATTVAAQTTCTPVTDKCKTRNIDASESTFNCSSAFQGALTQLINDNYYSDKPRLEYFTDSSLSKGVWYTNSTNPTYFGWSGAIDAGAGETLITADGTVTNIVKSYQGGLLYFVLSCSITIFDVTYNNINGSVTNFDTRPSNDSLAAIVRAPINRTDSAYPFLQQAQILASFSNSAQELADKLALSYSQAAMALVSGTFNPRPALLAQRRTQQLVARVPLAPLFTLIIANLAFVVLGLGLAVSALCVPHKEAREAQARLSIPGLVAERFERHKVLRRPATNVEELFEEYRGEDSVRIGFDGDENRGYSFKVEHHESLLGKESSQGRQEEA